MQNDNEMVMTIFETLVGHYGYKFKSLIRTDYELDMMLKLYVKNLSPYPNALNVLETMLDDERFLENPPTLAQLKYQCKLDAKKQKNKSDHEIDINAELQQCRHLYDHWCKQNNSYANLQQEVLEGCIKRLEASLQ